MPVTPPIPQEIATASGMVSSVLAESQSLAAQSSARGLAAIAALGDFMIDIPEIVLPDFSIPVITVPATGTPPADPGDLSLTLPDLPADPVQGDIGDLDVGEAPLYNLVAPLLVDIDLPDPLAAVVPAKPDLTVVAAPVEPSFVLPDVPTFTALNLPDAPTFEVEPFAEADPVAPSAPDPSFLWAEVAYQSDALAALNTRLLSLVNGVSSGLPADVEDMIWNKGCDAEAMLTFVAVDEALLASAARGFAIPGGQLVRIVQQAVAEGLSKDTELSRSVMVESAQLEQQNFQFAFSQAMQLEARLIELFNQVQQRALDAARFRVAFVIDLFNARVNLYQADVQAFSAKVDVYRGRVQAALARLDLYKAQLEAVQIRGELNVQLVHQYSAQIEAVKTGADVFRARVEAVGLAAEVNHNRIQLYRAEVEGYAALVKANGAQVQGYLSQVQAEQAKTKLFGHQVAAYGSRVEAYKALSDARLAEASFQFRQLQEFPMEMYKAKIDGFRSQVGAEAARLATTADVFQLRVEGYAAVERAGAQYGGAQADAATTTARLYASKAQIALQDGMTRIKLEQINAETAQSALRSAGQLATQLASAAMSARNVSASLTGSTSNSAGHSVSTSDSVSNSVGVSSSASTSRNASSTTGISNSASVSISTSQTSSDNQSWSESVDTSVSNSTSESASNDHSQSVRNSRHSSANLNRNYSQSTLYTHRR